MKRIPMVVLALLVLAAPVLAGPALNYRGPVNEHARGIAAPGEDGLIGTERLHSRSNRVEGNARWEFWWEHNRDRYLRRALKTNERQRTGTGGDVFYSAEPRRESQVTEKGLDDRIRPLLLGKLTSPNADERRIAALALGLAGDSGAFNELRKMLAKSGGTDRRSAALALGFLGDALAVSELKTLLGRSGVPIRDRATAALALGFIGGEDAVKALSTALVESLKHRGKDVVRLQAAMISALGLAGGREQLTLLIHIARQRENRSVEVRSAAINALGRLREAEAAPALIKLLKDPSSVIRGAAAEALGLLGRPETVVALKALFLGDGDPSVRSQAAMAMAQLGGDGVGDALVGGLHVRNPRVLREFCALALGVLGDHSHAARLRALLDGRQGEGLAGAAAISLGILRDSAAATPLRALYQSGGRDHAVSGYAVLALAMLGDTTTRDRINDLARKPGATHIRRSATLALGLFPRQKASRAVLGSLLEENDPYVRGAAINSLAMVPRQGAADMLLAVADAHGFSRQARADALIALGVLLRKGGSSRAEELVSGLHYRSAVAELVEVTELF